MDYSKDSNSKKYFSNMLKGIGISILTTLAFIIILTLIMTYTNLSESVIPIINSLIMILAIAVGAIYISSKSENKGWLHGSLIGILYILIIIILSSIFTSDFSIDKYVILKVVVSLVTGAIGGMIGINIK